MQFADTKSQKILSRKPGNIGNDSKSAFPSFVEQLQFVKVAKTTKDNGWHFFGSLPVSPCRSNKNGLNPLLDNGYDVTAILELTEYN